MPTARSNGGHPMVVTCNACQHSDWADYAAIIAAGKGDVPLTQLKLRCGRCGSRDYWFIMLGGMPADWKRPGNRCGNSGS